MALGTIRAVERTGAQLQRTRYDAVSRLAVSVVDATSSRVSLTVIKTVPARYHNSISLNVVVSV